MKSEFSVIIPTRDRPALLTQCLQGLVAQDFPKPFEVLVLDDGGNYDLSPFEERFRPLLSLKLLRQDNAGPATARNRAAQLARGERLAFIDDDCIPSPSWLSEFHALSLEHPRAALGGQTINLLNDNRYSQASQRLLDFVYRYHSQPENAGGRFFASNNLCLSRAEFWELGGFNENFPMASSEDREFSLRWTNTGRSHVFAPRAVVGHQHYLEAASFLRQHFNYGRGSHRHESIRRSLPHPPKREVSAFWRGLLKYANKDGISLGSLRLSVLLLLTQLAHKAGYLSARFRDGARRS